MSQAAVKMPLTKANALARSIVNELAPCCQRIEVAGSIRRCQEEVGDIEIVAVPKRAQGLFEASDNAMTQLDEKLNLLVMEERLTRIKDGPRYKQAWVVRHGIKLDLFLCQERSWGIIFAIRTGPVEFAKRLVTPVCKGGYLPDELSVRDGCLWMGDLAIETYEERDLFRALGLGWLEPRDRK